MNEIKRIRHMTKEEINESLFGMAHCYLRLVSEVVSIKNAIGEYVWMHEAFAQYIYPLPDGSHLPMYEAETMMLKAVGMADMIKENTKKRLFLLIRDMYDEERELFNNKFPFLKDKKIDEGQWKQIENGFGNEKVLSEADMDAEVGTMKSMEDSFIEFSKELQTVIKKI